MFKNYFKNLWCNIKTKARAAKKAKFFKTAGKVVTVVSKAAVVVTAFNLGNITEALAHMSDGPTGFGDTLRWFVILCTEFLKDIKNKNITWEVKHIFAPFVIAASYVGTKIGKFIHSIWGWFTKANKAMSNPIKIEKKSDVEVVNLFA